MRYQFINAIPGGTNAAVNQTTTGFEKPKYQLAAFQLVASTLDASDGVIKLQDSLDGLNWNDITGATLTVSSGSSSNMIRYTAFTGMFIRAVWTKNSITTGTILGNFLFKE